ncbi:MAG: UbiD family decarboxylase, partial [Bradyrhizobium sp.]|nr:UbiD family decarboxylase [Bradyrhizobium sp.]
MDVGAKGIAKLEATSSRQSMRAFLSALANAGDFATIPDMVSLDYELAACLAEADSGPALQFQSVKGHADGFAMPVVGNLLNSLSRIALGMGSTTRETQAA